MDQIIWILWISEFLVHIKKVFQSNPMSDFGQTSESFDKEHQVI